MDIGEMMLTGNVAPPSVLESANSVKVSNLGDEKKKQMAKDFESVFVHKLLDEMKNTIGDWGLEKDGQHKQIQGIFNMYLAQDVSKNGGLGMWKDIYQFFGDIDKTKMNTQSLDKNI